MSAKKQNRQYDQDLKEFALDQVGKGLSAAAVARELGLKPWLVQNWVRSATGTNKQRLQNRLLVGRTTFSFDGKKYLYFGKFTAYDKNRRQYVILHFKERVLERVSEEGSESFLLITDRGRQVEYLNRGLYKLGSGLILESFDPKAI